MYEKLSRGYSLNMDVLSKYTNAEIHRATGMERSNVSTMLARGRVTMETAKHLAESLGLTLDDVLVKNK